MQATSLTYTYNYTIYLSFRLNKEKYRKYRLCPIPGCKSKPQKKLPNHMAKFHSRLSLNQKKRLLRKAQVVKQDHIKVEPSQTKLTLEPADTVKIKKTGDRLGGRKGKAVTRTLGRFKASHPELQIFKQHLMGLAGKKKSEKSATSVVTDISKMLYFHNDEELQWNSITDRQKLLLYMNKLQDLNVGPEGQLTKLERVCAAYHFLKRTKKDDRELSTQIKETEGEIYDWKKTLRRQKQALNVRRLEKTSEMDLNMGEITEVVDNPTMWAKFSDIVTRAKNGRDVPENDLKLAMGIMAAAVKLKSYQRPSAIINCTVEEYERAKCPDDMGTTVIKVYNHKTGSQGPANLTLDSKTAKRLDLYFKYIRPLLVEPGEDIDNLFILPGSQKITKITNLESFVSKTLGILIPTSTKARKIGSTLAARNLDYQKHSLITKQMSHQPEVSRKFYEAVHGPQDAAAAFQTMEQLRTGSTSCPTEPHLAIGDSALNKRWSPADTNLIKKLFASDIKKMRTPGVAQCTDLGLDRTPKQIQDKVRTIIRQAKKETEDC